MVGLGVETSVAARRTTVPLGRCTGCRGTVTAAARPLAAGTPGGAAGEGGCHRRCAAGQRHTLRGNGHT